MKSERFLIAAVTGMLLIAAAIGLFRSRENPLLTDHDIPHYATILVDADGADFSRDPVFKGRSSLVWRASFGYMGLLEIVARASRYDFRAALAILQLLLIAIYVPSMTRLLAVLGASVHVALAVAVVSVFPASFLVTGTRWGILTPPVPLVVCTALAPLIALAVLRLRSSIAGAVLAASAVALPMVLINPATGMALIALFFVLAVVGAFRRVISVRTLIVLTLTIAVWGFVAQALIRSESAGYSFAAAAEMVRYGQDHVMVWPFRGAAADVSPMLFFHALASVILLAAAHFVPARRRILLAMLIAVQALYAGFFLRTGWLVLLPLAEALDTIRREKFGSMESWLWTALGFGIAIGPLQQVATLFLWDQFQITALTPVVFEGARFLHFSFLPMFALVALAIDSIRRSFADVWIRPAVVAFLAFITYLDLDTAPYPLGGPRAGMVLIAAISALWLTRETWLPWFEPGVDRPRAITVAIVAAGAGVATALLLFRLDLVSIRVPAGMAACVALALFSMAESRASAKAFIVSCALIAFVAAPCMALLLKEPVRARSGMTHETLAFAVKLPREERNRPPAASPCDTRVLSADFLAVTAFAHQRLPPSSLFHVLTFDRGFRAYARRGMLPVSDEWLIPIYDGAPIQALRQMSNELWNARNDFEESRRLASRFGASYVVACGQPGNVPRLYASGPYAVYPVK